GKTVTAATTVKVSVAAKYPTSTSGTSTVTANSFNATVKVSSDEKEYVSNLSGYTVKMTNSYYSYPNGDESKITFVDRIVRDDDLDLSNGFVSSNYFDGEFANYGGPEDVENESDSDGGYCYFTENDSIFIYGADEIYYKYYDPVEDEFENVGTKKYPEYEGLDADTLDALADSEWTSCTGEIPAPANNENGYVIYVKIVIGDEYTYFTLDDFLLYVYEIDETNHTPLLIIESSKDPYPSTDNTGSITPTDTVPTAGTGELANGNMSATIGSELSSAYTQDTCYVRTGTTQQDIEAYAYNPQGTYQNYTEYYVDSSGNVIGGVLAGVGFNFADIVKYGDTASSLTEFSSHTKSMGLKSTVTISGSTYNIIAYPDAAGKIFAVQVYPSSYSDGIMFEASGKSNTGNEYTKMELFDLINAYRLHKGLSILKLSQVGGLEGEEYGLKDTDLIQEATEAYAKSGTELDIAEGEFDAQTGTAVHYKAVYTDKGGDGVDNTLTAIEAFLDDSDASSYINGTEFYDSKKDAYWTATHMCPAYFTYSYKGIYAIAMLGQ
nr:hypothetical protein [Lachnospiraceae bacterium]